MTTNPIFYKCIKCNKMCHEKNINKPYCSKCGKEMENERKN